MYMYNKLHNELMKECTAMCGGFHPNICELRFLLLCNPVITSSTTQQYCLMASICMFKLPYPVFFLFSL